MSKSTRKQKPRETDVGFEQVAAEFREDSSVKRGRMFSSESVLSVNGRIFAMLAKGKFVVKLPKERVDLLVNDGVGANWGPGTGRVMKEWVTIKSGKASWIKLAKEAYEFVKRGKT